MAGLVLLVACGEPDSKPPPPIASAGNGNSDTGGDTGIPDPFPDTAGPGSGGLPAHCMLPEEGGVDESGDEGDTASGFKFDVGAPEGSSDFPVDCTEVEETLSNLGCLFWATDLANDYRGTPMSPPASEQQFAVVVANASSLEAAQVDVYIAAETDAVDTAMVPPGDIHVFSLDPLDIDPTMGTVDGRAYRIESSVPITAYQFNPLDNQVEVYSNDASLLLPEHALGREYTAVTGDAILLSMSADDPDPVNAGAFVSVVATEDDTDVEVVPSSLTLPGPTSATIDRGEVFTVISDVTGANSGNLSGSRVTANRAVAVFSGNVATAVPASTQNCCADHIEHQMPPHEAWGTAYAAAPPPSPIADADDTALYRITGAFDGTELRYCPEKPEGAPDTLQPGETIVFTTDEAFTVEADPDKPFALTQFLLSFQALSADQPGDPAMIVMPSLGQLQRRYLFAVPAGYAENHVTIVTRGDPVVSLDGEAIPEEDFAEIGVARGKMHHRVSVPVGTGAHLVEAEVPVGITVIGLDDAVSYGFPGGAGLRVIAIPPTAG